MKCPCEECISYAICINSKSVTKLLDECNLIFDYINDWGTTIKAIEVLKPNWYRKNPSGLQNEAEHLLDEITSRKAMMIAKAYGK